MWSTPYGNSIVHISGMGSRSRFADVAVNLEIDLLLITAICFSLYFQNDLIAIPTINI